MTNSTVTNRYIKKSQQRIQILFKKELFEKDIAPCIKKSGKPMSTFIKEAVMEKVEREKASYPEK